MSNDPKPVNVKIELETLKKQGLLIDLEIRGIGMFSRQASWSEMGIGENDDDPRYTNLRRGQKLLIPIEHVKTLRSIESKMRQLLDKVSFDVTGFRPFRWLPYTSYDSFKEKWERLVNQLEAEKSVILAHYTEYVDRLADEYTKLAESSWKAITVQSYGTYEWVIVNGVGYNHDGFIDLIVSAAVAKMPAQSEIMTCIGADYRLGNVVSDASLLEEKLAVEKINAERELVQTETALKRQKLIEMQAAEVAHYKATLAETASPFEEVFTELRRRVASDARSMLDTIKKNGKVASRVATQGAGLIKLFEMMAIHDDSQLKGILTDLKAEIGTVGGDTNPDDRNVEKIQDLLNQVLEMEKQAAAHLTEGPNRFEMLEI